MCVYYQLTTLRFAKLLAQIIRLGTQSSDYAMKTTRFENVDEFTYQIFKHICISVG